MRPAHRQLISIGILLATTPLLLAMGTTGGNDLSNPVRDYHATLTDRDGVKVAVTRMTIGGNVQLEGDMGRGTLHISFDNIRSVDFSPDAHDYSKATVHLKSGEAVTVRVRNSLMVYGQTDVGAYQVRARDLQNIAFS